MELLLLLLPIAAASGWFAAKRSSRRTADLRLLDRHPGYLQGLNYLLNEQPDKAIDVFVTLVEVDSETVETHLALGNLFRRRGEVDRAIRIHQNLIARSKLSPDLRAQALLELGLDYMRAGLFDRAESLFIELAESEAYREQSLRNLLVVYQQEKDWTRCLEVAEKLQSHTGRDMRTERAHYYCELAEAELDAGDPQSAMALIAKARGVDGECVRASILEGNLELARGNFEAAIRNFQELERQDLDYVSEVLGPLRSCFENQGRIGDLRAYLLRLQEQGKDIATALRLADIIQEQDGDEPALDFLAAYLHDYPSLRGLDRLIAYKLDNRSDPAADTLQILKDLVTKMLKNCPAYQCRQCGFSAKKLHWNCPGCKTWSSMKPVQGFDAELR